MTLSTTLLQLANTEGVRIKLREYAEKQYPINLQNVHTPFPLVKEMIDKLPSLEGYILTFNMEFVEVLIYDYNVDPKMIYFLSDCGEKVDIIKGKKRYEGVRSIKCDVLNNKTRFTMKFDVICGNPPYQKQVGPSKTEPLWDKFVDKAFEIVKDDGYVCLVHPSGWRNAKGRFEDTKNVLMSREIIHLSLNDFNKGKETFGVGTNYDWYIVKNSPANDLPATITTSDGDEHNVNLKNMSFIPNGRFEEFKQLVGEPSEERVEIMFSTSFYDHRKPYLSEQKDDEHKLPVVYSITQKNGTKLMYSSEDKGHFGTPKVIWSNGLGTYPIVDSCGEYAMTEFASAIVDSPENLENIAKALSSAKFLALMKYVKFKNDIYDYRVIGTFRKDFWKDFI